MRSGITSVPRWAAVSFVLLCASFGYGALMFSLLPRGVTTMGDDFAFYRSVAATIQHHRPWTDDYLEPWAATLSVLSAGLFLITHSFTAATNGLVLLLAALSFGGCSLLLLNRGVSRITAVAIATALLSSPLPLQYTLEFTSWIVYLPCLLWALWAAERKSWGCFTVAWLAALATRQTAIVWGILPAAEALMGWRRDNGSPWRAPVVAVLVGAAAFAVLFLTMNRTAAYLHLTKVQVADTGRQIFDWRHDAGLVARFMIGGYVFGLAVGFGSGLRNPASPSHRSPTFSRLGIGVVLAVVLVALSRFINFTHFGYDGRWTIAYYLLLAVLGTLGWAVGPAFTVNRPIALAAAAGVALISLHTPLNAAYLLEPALLGLFAAVPINGAGPCVTQIRRRSFFPALPFAAIGVLLCCHLVWAFDLKSNFDRHFARVRVAELALRQGQIALGDLPPGVETLTYWHALPYLASHPHSHFVLHTLLPRLRTPNVTVKFIESFSPPLREWPGFEDTSAQVGAEVLQQETFRCAWFAHGTVALVRLGHPSRQALIGVRRSTGAASEPTASQERGAPPVADREASPFGVTTDITDYASPNFPLNDAEWRKFIAQRGPAEPSHRD